MHSSFAKFANDLIEDSKKKLRSLLIDKAGQFVKFNAEDELKKLEKKFLEFQTSLDGFQPTSQTSKDWIGEVNRVYYDAQELVEDIKGASTSSVAMNFVKLFTKDDYTEKTKQLLGKLELLISKLDKVKKTTHSCKDNLAGKQQLVLPNKLIGRATDKEKIINMLLEDTIKSVSILGMHGIGKSTLAHYVKDDPKIRDKFDHIVWVSVSATFDFDKISKSILQDSDLSQSVSDDLATEKRILIVLDDLRELKYTEWNKLYMKFRCFNGGCKVLLTTTNPNVAKASYSTPYCLRLMEDDDCRAIIIDRVFSFGNFVERDLKIVEGVSVEMAQKCKGLPLAANILGLLLSSDHGVDRLMTLSKSDIQEFKVYNEEIFPIFRLDNPILESHLRKCVDYYSLFPYDFKFERDYLVQLWRAEGFLGLQGTTKQTGVEYFEELLSRSVFQFSDLGEQEIPIYMMHEFIHKFSEFMASDTYCRVEKGEHFSSSPCYREVRHLSLLCYMIDLKLLQKIEECRGLRTLLLLRESETKIATIPYSFFIKLGRLRVLNLSNTNINEFPESLGELKQLTYLDASKTLISRLPMSTSTLHGLQVLKLRDCSKLENLPERIKCLTNLEQLDVNMKRLKCMPPSIGSLIYLQTLSDFVVGKKEGHHITELKNLNNLRGIICVSKLEYVTDGVQAREAEIKRKDFLKRLELKWSYPSEGESMVMEALEPHTNLEELQVLNYGGPSFPAWLTSPSFKLVTLHLKNCRQVDVLPPLGILPFLKRLHIEGLHRVRYVDCSHFSGQEGFPKLEILRMENMLGLERCYKMSESDSSMLQLRELIVVDCPKLLEIEPLKHLNSLKKLEINTCKRFWSLPELPAPLQELIIAQCDHRLNQYQCEPGGFYWSKIEGIPYVEIDYVQVLP